MTRSEDDLERDALKLLGNLPARVALSEANFGDPALGSIGHLRTLHWGYEWSLRQAQGSGSHFATSTQLFELHQAADAFGLALRKLQLPAYHALRFPRDAAMDDLWRKAAGKPWLANCDPWDGGSKEEARGSLAAKFNVEELEALGKFSLLQSRHWKKVADQHRGTHSVFEAHHGTPKKQLANACLQALVACGQPLDNLKPLMRLIHEAVVGKRPPNMRWAEREAQQVRKAYTDSQRKGA